ncbi:MAG: hypothetical protein RL230_366 [Pseudomonadota bacterium]
MTGLYKAIAVNFFFTGAGLLVHIDKCAQRNHLHVFIQTMGNTNFPFGDIAGDYAFGDLQVWDLAAPPIRTRLASVLW